MPGLKTKEIPEISRKKLCADGLQAIRHDYKRAVYRVFLQEFPPEVVREYFSLVPLEIDGRVISGKALFEALWRKKSLVPSSWEIRTDNLLEEFLLAKGKEPAELMPKILWRNGGRAPIPGRLILSWFYPKLEALFSSVDTREMCIGLITTVTENWLPGIVHRRIRKRERDGWIENTMAFIADPKFTFYLDWDYEFIAGPQMIEAPKIVGLPPFEQFGMLADTRSPEHIVRVAEDRPVHVNGLLHIRDQVAGRIMDFSEFCAINGLDVSKYDPPDLEVAVMDKDYICPIRKRIVLHAGCAYGAPFFISWLEHRKLASTKQSLLTKLVADIAREEMDDEEELERKHRELLATLAIHSDFVYHADDESMSLNGRHFVKGIPAKILRNLLQAYLQAGKLEFEYRDFKRDFEISLGQKNSNFEVRFYRLVDKLAEQGACLRILKTGRGTFALKVDGEVTFVEAPSNSSAQ
jgi:hypothetical protein